MNYLILFFIAVCGIILGVGLAQRNGCKGRKPPLNFLKRGQSKKKIENKEKILGELKKSEDGKIQNEDVVKMLGVSDATAERYLDEIEKEGKIEQKGKTGNAVYYVLR